MAADTQKYFYILPTPGGAYFSVSVKHESAEKLAICKLMSVDTTPAATTETLDWLYADLDVGNQEEHSKELQKNKLVQGIKQAETIQTGNFGDILPSVISQLSMSKRALIADSQGFCLSATGFSQGLIEEISVLAADIADLHQRRARDVDRKLDLNSSAWAIVDASGNSKLGFWPFQVGGEVFVLAIEGVPFLNHPALVELIWLLQFRYGR